MELPGVRNGEHPGPRRLPVLHCSRGAIHTVPESVLTSPFARSLKKHLGRPQRTGLCWKWRGQATGLPWPTLGPSGHRHSLPAHTPGFSHPADTPCPPGHPEPAGPSPRPGSLFLHFLGNFSSLKTQLCSPLSCSPPGHLGRNKSLCPCFPAPCTHTCHADNCHTALSPYPGSPVTSLRVAGQGLEEDGFWRALPPTAMFVSHGLPTSLSCRVLTGLVMPMRAVLRSTMLDTA